MRAELAKYNFPLDARARMTANTRSSSWVLFEGSARDLTTHRRVRVIDVDHWDAVQFRLRVSERSGGKLLGTTTRFKLDPVDEDSSGILTVRKGQTGELPYKLELSRHSSPALVISSALWDKRYQLREDLMFRSIMLPDVVRQVLRFAILDAGLYEHGNTDAMDDNWFGDWLQWMDSYEGLTGFVDSLEDVEDEPDAIMNWIDDAVSAFATNPDNRFVRKIANQLKGQ